MKKIGLSALVSPRVLVGIGLVTLTSLFGGTGCVSYSLTGLTVQPGTGLTCIPNNTTAQYNAYGTYTEGGHSDRIEDITSQVQWSVVTPQLATITTAGLLLSNRGAYVGTSGIVATTEGEFGNLTAYSSIQVSTDCSGASGSLARPFTLNIVAGNPDLTVGRTLQPLAIATYPDDRHTEDLSAKVTWSSSNPAVATVDAHGVISALAPGDATISAHITAPTGETVTAAQPLHFVAGSQQN